jgi:hypothetical protein
MPPAHVVTAETTGDWEEGDFAPQDDAFQGQPIGSMILPMGGTVHFDQNKQRVSYIRFPSWAPEENQDEGTTFWIAFLKDQRTKWLVSKVNRALNGYAIRFISRGFGMLYDRGMYVLRDIDRGSQQWKFSRLADRHQGEFPSIEHLFSELSECSQTASKKTVYAIARPSDRVTPVINFASEIASPAVSPPRKRPAQMTLNSGALVLLDWFATDSCGPRLPDQPLAAFELLEVVSGAMHALGLEGVATAEFVSALTAAFTRCGCMVSRTTQQLCLLNGPGLRLRERADVLPIRPLEIAHNHKDHTARQLRNEKTFLSRLEFEHFLLLWRLFPCVLYETETLSFQSPTGLVNYTPDFYLPGIRADLSSDPSAGLLIESKSDYPSLSEISKCMRVTEKGRDIILLYGYPGVPLRVGRDPASAGGRSTGPEWRRGIMALTFKRVASKAVIAQERAMLCIDEGRLTLRPLVDEADRGWEHLRLTTLYSEIEAVPSPMTSSLSQNNK